MTLLVTGATGFIGRHLCAALTAKQQPVLALMRRPSGLELLREQVTGLGGDGRLVNALPGDLSAADLGISTPMPELDAIIHLGASFGWRLDRETARSTNVAGSTAVAELAHRQRCRLVYVSGFMLENSKHLRSIGVNIENPAATYWPGVYRRAGVYEASKLEAAFAVRALASRHNLDLVEVQPATVAGHSRTGALDPAQPLYQLIDNLARGRLSLIPGTPAHWLPMVPVDDLAALLAEAALTATPPARLLVLDPDTPALADMIGLIAAALGRKPPGHHIPIGLLRLLLALPGMPRLMNTYPEALHFIQTNRFDSRESEAFIASHGLARANIREVIEKTALHYARTLPE